MSNLTFTETKDLKFKHDGYGVHAILKGKKTTFNLSTVLKEDASLTDKEMKEYIKLVLTAQNMLNRLPLHKIDDFRTIDVIDIVNDYTPFYKYTSMNSYENFFKRGQWQLGCIQQYKTIENKKQRDEFEGQCFMNMMINNHKTNSLVCTGFNYLIFCGTRKASSELHKDSFGEKELYFPNVRSFADSVKKTIGAKRYYIQNVEYNTSKWFNVKDHILDDQVNLEDIINTRYVELINQYSVYPSLFVKPEAFCPENEVRIVFEMDKDYNKPLRFENRSLLDYVKH